MSKFFEGQAGSMELISHTTTSAPDDSSDASEASFREQPSEPRERVLIWFLPAIVVLGAVYAWPIGRTIWLSTRETRLFRDEGSAGLGNYRDLLDDPNLWKNLSNTLMFGFGTLALALPAGLLAAVLMDRATTLKRTLRSVLLLPWLMSQATAGVIWAWFLEPGLGPASSVAQNLGLDKLTLFSDPTWALPTLMIVTAWWSYPIAMIFFIGALQQVPQTLYDSIRVDGGGRWSEFWNATFPFIRNSIIIVGLIQLMLYFNMVTIFLVTTGGGPLRETETFSLRIYREIFLKLDLGGAATSTMFMLVVNIALMGAVILLRRREELV